MCFVKVRTVLPLLLLLMLSALTPFPSFAQDISSSRETSSGDTLSQSMISEKAYRPSVSGQVISGERLSRGVTISDALREFSGVQIKDYGGVGGLKTINVRSLGSEHTAVFIDGLPVDNAQNMQVDLGRFDPWNYDEAHLRSALSPSPTPTARSYGSASSLYLESAEPSIPQGRNSSLKLRLRGGSFALFEPSLKWDTKVGSRSIISTSLSFTTTNGKYRFHESRYQTYEDGSVRGYDTVMVRSNGDLTSLKTQVSLFTPIGEGRLKATGYFYTSGRGLPGPVVRRPVGSITTKDRQEDRNIFLQGTYDVSPKEWMTLSIRGKLSRDYLRYHTNPEEDPQAMPVDNSFHQSSAYASASVLLRPSFLPFIVNSALDIQWDMLDSDMAGFVYPRRLSLWGALSLKKDAPKWGASLSGQYACSSDSFSKGSEAGGFSKEGSRRGCFSPMLTLRYSPLGDSPSEDPLLFEAFAKRTFRMPSFNDLYYTMLGNSSLEPEKAWQFDFGGKWTVKRERISTSVKADVYYNIVSNKIVALPTYSQFRWSMYNIGLVHVTGFEASALSSFKIGKGDLDVTLRYTFQDARDRTDPSASSYGGQIPYIPKHAVSGVVSYEIGPWKASISTLWDSKRWSSSVNRQEYELDSFLLMDADISRSFKVAGGLLRSRLSIGNILGARYEIVSGYPMPLQSAIASLEYSF